MLVDPSLDELLTKVDNKFRLVTLALKRARQINESNHLKSDDYAGGTVIKPVSLALQEIDAEEVFVDNSVDVKAENIHPSRNVSQDLATALALDNSAEARDMLSELNASNLDNAAESMVAEDFFANMSATNEEVKEDNTFPTLL